MVYFINKGNGADGVSYAIIEYYEIFILLNQKNPHAINTFSLY